MLVFLSLKLFDDKTMDLILTAIVVFQFVLGVAYIYVLSSNASSVSDLVSALC